MEANTTANKLNNNATFEANLSPERKVIKAPTKSISKIIDTFISL